METPNVNTVNEEQLNRLRSWGYEGLGDLESLIGWLGRDFDDVRRHGIGSYSAHSLETHPEHLYGEGNTPLDAVFALAETVKGGESGTNDSREGTVVDSALLEPVTSVSLPAVEAFSAKDHFKVGKVDGVTIGWIGDTFTGNFLTGPGKNEIDVPAAGLRVHKLRRGSVDEPVVAELGGEEQVETYLACMWEMMKLQGAGQNGDLLVNGYANIFYVRDDNGVLWAAYCIWYSGARDWFVGADPVTYPREWSAGFQVFSR